MAKRKRLAGASLEEHGYAELRIGDQILMSNNEMVVQGDGVMQNSISGVHQSSTAYDVHECVFELCVPTRNSAADELERFLSSKGNVPFHLFSDKDRRRLKTLRSLQQKEADLNAKLMDLI